MDKRLLKYKLLFIIELSTLPSSIVTLSSKISRLGSVQFVMALTTTFISILSFSYLAALMIIRSTRPFVQVASEFAFTSTRLIPLFSPCIFCDQIQEEVRRLREHVASRLYEDKLNKPGRSVARALLALTEARDLSFSLLQIFDIDISLPFKFMGLLLTYLIILLQFEKVINP